MLADLFRRIRAPGVAAVLLLVLGGSAASQQLTGNIYGTVADEQGGRLPGVVVTLSGGGAPQTFTTDARGEYRFLGLAPGSYTLTYELSGFTKVTKESVQVAVGQNTNTSATLRLSAVAASITVRGETALLDTRKVQTGATVSQVELKSIPSARDPWVIMQTVPGVLMDRINIGGNESGQQSNFVGKGTNNAQTVWNLDGVTITDMGAIGASPSYYDFDSFEELHISTGGTDLTAATAGVQLNMVTKRGTNDVHGSARVLLTKDDWQSSNLPDEAKEQGVGGGNRIDEVQDYGVEVGGPIIRDRLWLWGSYGRNQIDLVTINGDSDKTTLEGTNAKLNVQFFESTSGTVFYTKDDKIKLGRNAGPTRPPETAWNQDGPTKIYKGELSQVFSPNLFMTASYAYVDLSFRLVPLGGLDTDYYQDADGVFHGTYQFFQTFQPQHVASVGGSYFFNTGSLGHELKYGFQYRKTPVSSIYTFPGSSSVGFEDPSGPFANLYRNVNFSNEGEWFNAYLGDTLTAANLTINAGVRWDLQRGNPGRGTVEANPVIPDILPAFDYSGGDRQFEWEDFSPRVGATYSVGDKRKLLLKGSYARFADQLGLFPLVAQTNAIPNYSYLEYYWNDTNGDHLVQRDELDFDTGIIYAYNVDPTDTTSFAVFNQTDPNFEAGHTDEFIVGFDYELFPEFVIGANYTYRQYEGDYRQRSIGLTNEDFELVETLTGTLFDGTSYSEPLYGLRPDVGLPSGTILENRPNYKTRYHGIDLTAQKRLSNHWMLRGTFGWNDWTQRNGTNGCFRADPTNAILTRLGATCPGDDIVAERSAGSGAKQGIFINAKWQFNVTALWEGPYGFNLAANLFGRQGYPYPNWVRENPGDGLGSRDVVIGKLDDHRHDDVFSLDMRVEKIINVSPVQISLTADVFNVTNENPVNQRNGRVNQSTYNNIQELQAPRVVRLGARVSF